MINTLTEKNLNEIISYKRISNDITIDWLVGNYCNYKCDYCFSDSNKGDKKVPPLEDINDNVDYLYDEIEKIGKTPFFVLSGGEPTMYSGLLDIIEKAKLRFPRTQALIVTNGSRTLNFWQRNKNNFDKIAISFHVGQADPQHILDVCKIIEEKDVCVTIMLHPDTERFEKGLQIRKWFIKNGLTKYAVLTLKLLDDQVEITKLMDYSEDQILRFKDRCFSPRDTDIKVNFNSERTIAIDKYNIHNINANYLAQLDPDFTGWKCHVASERITIAYNGDLIANCLQEIYPKKFNLYTSNLREENFKIRKDPVVCTVGKCRCLGLYNISKFKF